MTKFKVGDLVLWQGVGPYEITRDFWRLIVEPNNWELAVIRHPDCDDVNCCVPFVVRIDELELY